MTMTEERIKRTDRLEKVRANRVTQAKRLKKNGLSSMAIAFAMGVKESTARAWLKQEA